MKNSNRDNYQGMHILSADCSICSDTWKSGINNNVLVFGPSGSGKTRCYVMPNIQSGTESMIISDTKGTLFGTLGPALKKQGYRVMNIDFTDLKHGCGYNPLDYIRYDAEKKRYSEQDILSIAGCLISNWSQKEPYWDFAAKQVISCLIAYVLEALPEKEHTLEYVVKLLPLMTADTVSRLMEETRILEPDSTVGRRYAMLDALYDNGSGANKMFSSIIGVISTNLDSMVFDEAIALFTKKQKVDFAAMGREKTALFLTVSDTDRSLDKLANCFMTQALQVLCRSADHDYPDHRLPVPVRLYLDDFATNLFIPDFDKTISVIRSREIYVSVILQSLTQLYTLYGDAAAKTIVNNCDMQLYLGGQDLDTAGYISQRINKPMSTVLSMPLENVWLMVRGRAPRQTRKYGFHLSEQS